MNKKGWEIWNNLTFKTQGYRKNFDLVTENENIITEYIGTISELRIEGDMPPLIIGDYGFSVWNLGLAKTLDVDLHKLIKAHRMENTYDELLTVIDKKKFNIDGYDKIVLIHSLVIHPAYRKIGVTEEFIESIYRDFHAENVAIVALVKPLQDNVMDAEYYFKLKTIQKRENAHTIVDIPAIDYYSLNDLMKKTDTEINEYKLYSVAQRCGFQRINESHLFILNPEIIINRIKEKRNV
jgi:hypothetical protein